MRIKCYKCFSFVHVEPGAYNNYCPSCSAHLWDHPTIPDIDLQIKQTEVALAAINKARNRVFPAIVIVAILSGFLSEPLHISMNWMATFVGLIMLGGFLLILWVEGSIKLRNPHIFSNEDWKP